LLLIERAIALANAAADGAGDEEVTPSQIAVAIGDAIEALESSAMEVAARLRQASDAVADGMPPDYTAAILYSALSLY
jgi:hypothetical protein